MSGVYGCALEISICDVNANTIVYVATALQNYGNMCVTHLASLALAASWLLVLRGPCSKLNLL